MEFSVFSSASFRISAGNTAFKAYMSHGIMQTKFTTRPSILLPNCTVNLTQKRPFGRRNCSKSLSIKTGRRFSSCIQACTQVGPAESEPVVNNLLKFIDASWRFLRPYTIQGTALGSASLVARELIRNSHLIKWSLLFKAFCGLFALISGNGYIVGVNQI